MISTRDLKDFHCDENMQKRSTKPFREEQKKVANMVKSKIISTLMCLVVQEKIGKESLPTASLPKVYHWDEYATKEIWRDFLWQYKDNDGEYKNLPGRKESNGKWPCLDEYLLDHWLTSGKIKCRKIRSERCCEISIILFRGMQFPR